MKPFSFAYPVGKRLSIFKIVCTRLLGRKEIDKFNGNCVYQWRGYTLITTP